MVVVRSITWSTFSDGGTEFMTRGRVALHRVDGVDDVGARLLVDQQQDAELAVLEAADLGVLRAVDGDADVADADRRAVAVGDDDVVPGRGLQQLVVVVDREILAPSR